MAFLSVTQARNNLSELVSKADQSPTVLIKDSKPAAVLLGINEYRSLTAARSLARDPQRLAEIHRAHERIRAGDESDVVALHEEAGAPAPAAAVAPAAEAAVPASEVEAAAAEAPTADSSAPAAAQRLDRRAGRG